MSKHGIHPWITTNKNIIWYLYPKNGDYNTGSLLALTAALTGILKTSDPEFQKLFQKNISKWCPSPDLSMTGYAQCLHLSIDYPIIVYHTNDAFTSDIIYQSSVTTSDVIYCEIQKASNGQWVVGWIKNLNAYLNFFKEKLNQKQATDTVHSLLAQQEQDLTGLPAYIVNNPGLFACTHPKGGLNNISTALSFTASQLKIIDLDKLYKSKLFGNLFEKMVAQPLEIDLSEPAIPKLKRYAEWLENIVGFSFNVYHMSPGWIARVHFKPENSQMPKFDGQILSNGESVLFLITNWNKYKSMRDVHLT